MHISFGDINKQKNTKLQSLVLMNLRRADLTSVLELWLGEKQFWVWAQPHSRSNRAEGATSKQNIFERAGDEALVRVARGAQLWMYMCGNGFSATV